MTVTTHSKPVRKIEKTRPRRAKVAVGQGVSFFSADEPVPPITASLIGLLKGKKASLASYGKHRREKFR